MKAEKFNKINEMDARKLCECQLLYEEEVVYNQDGLSCIRTCPSSSRASSSTWSRQSAVTDASAHLE